MKEELIIKSYCRIFDKKIIIDGDVAFHDVSPNNFAEFSKAAYKFFNLSYLKFFKMDNHSKLGFLGADILLRKYSSEISTLPENTGIVLANSSSSLDTDFTYYDSIKDRNNYFPSPSVFVYTLPNIVIGEICIRHKIFGENAFFVSEKFDVEFMHKYIAGLFETNKVERCLTGWVEMMDGKYDAALFLVDRSDKLDEACKKFNVDNIKKLLK